MLGANNRASEHNGYTGTNFTEDVRCTEQHSYSHKLGKSVAVAALFLFGITEYDLGGATAFAAMHGKEGTDNDLTTVGINFSF